jgi:hypothetical protein
MAGLSAWRGIRSHGQYRTLIPFAVAAALMVVSRFVQTDILEMAFAVSGGLLFVAGHFLNHRLGHCSHTHGHQHRLPTGRPEVQIHPYG